MHHANVIISGADCRNFVFAILEKNLNFNIKANPDFWLAERESFGIDDARDLEKWVSGKPLLGDVKVYLVVTKSITPEAQNALLKVLEEPPLGTYIFINLESLGGILPTFISRVRILDLKGHPLGQNFLRVTLKEDIGAQKFLISNLKEKLVTIRSLSKKEDKNEMREILKSLEIVAYKNKTTVSLNHILTAKIFASTRGASPKMLLEWLSTVL